MIKVNELRIGNYVIDNRGRICQVTEINNDTSELTYGFMAWPVNGEGTTTTPHKPIPLTEQWLLDFGFDKKEVFWALNGIYVEKIEDGFLVCLGEFEIFVDTVHHFQNLYFAIKTEELTKSE